MDDFDHTTKTDVPNQTGLPDMEAKTSATSAANTANFPNLNGYTELPPPVSGYIGVPPIPVNVNCPGYIAADRVPNNGVNPPVMGDYAAATEIPVNDSFGYKTMKSGEFRTRYTSRYHEDFYHISFIGKGAFGHVLECQNKVDDRMYAVKIVPLPNT